MDRKPVNTLALCPEAEEESVMSEKTFWKFFGVMGIFVIVLTGVAVYIAVHLLKKVW